MDCLITAAIRTGTPRSAARKETRLGTTARMSSIAPLHSNFYSSRTPAHNHPSNERSGYNKLGRCAYCLSLKLQLVGLTAGAAQNARARPGFGGKSGATWIFAEPVAHSSVPSRGSTEKPAPPLIFLTNAPS